MDATNRAEADEPPPESLVVRRAAREDTPAICDLLAQVCPANPKVGEAVLAWQYWDNPYGTTSSWIAEEEGRVLAHYAAFPVPVPGRLDGERAVLAVGANAATRREARGRGLFTHLAAAAWQGAWEEGCRVVLAAPGPSSLRGAVRAGMVAVAELPVYVRPLDDTWFARRFHVPRRVVATARRVAFRPRPRTLRAEQVAAPPEGLDALDARSAVHLPWAVRADAAWWRWRFADRPLCPARGGYRYFAAERDGRLAGAATTTERDIEGGRFLLVLELLVDDEEAAAAVLEAAVGDARAAVGAALVAVPGTRMVTLATAGGFRRLPRRLEPQPLHFGVVPKDLSIPGAAAQPWSVSWSLLDHL